jgi:hypothetical protein
VNCARARHWSSRRRTLLAHRRGASGATAPWLLSAVAGARLAARQALRRCRAGAARQRPGRIRLRTHGTVLIRQIHDLGRLAGSAARARHALDQRLVVAARGSRSAACSMEGERAPKRARLTEPEHPQPQQLSGAGAEHAGAARAGAAGDGDPVEGANEHAYVRARRRRRRGRVPSRSARRRPSFAPTVTAAAAAAPSLAAAPSTHTRTHAQAYCVPATSHCHTRPPADLACSPRIRFRNYAPRDAALKAGVIAPPPAPSAVVEAAVAAEREALIAQSLAVRVCPVCCGCCPHFEPCTTVV